jgi:hypothetical protein
MNHATRANVASIGVIFGISGITHGLAEALHGNTPTGGLLINAIAAGSSWTRWSAGGEAAFTLIPNFLLAGVLTMLVGLTIIVWSLGFVHRQYGPAVYLLLFVLLFLVGGGIAQVAFVLPAWAVATRIHTPLTWWRRVLPVGLSSGLARLWPWLLAVASALILMTLAIAIFGYIPGVPEMDRVLRMMLALAGAAWVSFMLAFVSGFAHDIERGQGALSQTARGAA